jgi:hypothetical protein
MSRIERDHRAAPARRSDSESPGIGRHLGDAPGFDDALDVLATPAPIDGIDGPASPTEFPSALDRRGGGEEGEHLAAFGVSRDVERDAHVPRTWLANAGCFNSDDSDDSDDPDDPDDLAGTDLEAFERAHRHEPFVDVERFVRAGLRSRAATIEIPGLEDVCSWIGDDPRKTSAAALARGRKTLRRVAWPLYLVAFLAIACALLYAAYAVREILER